MGSPPVSEGGEPVDVDGGGGGRALGERKHFAGRHSSGVGERVAVSALTERVFGSDHQLVVPGEAGEDCGGGGDRAFVEESVGGSDQLVNVVARSDCVASDGCFLDPLELD